MIKDTILPHLFRTEYQKLVAVLCRLFGIEYIEIAEDIVSDTFLSAAELWGIKGMPENPTAWLYTVAKNKTKDYLKHHTVFSQKVSKVLQNNSETWSEPEIDLSVKNIRDSQLAMIFVVCNPCNAPQTQISMALNLLCGFGAEEIASAFLMNKRSVYKRLQRGKDRLRAARVVIGQPSFPEIDARLKAVATTLYLLFNEGYYSCGQNIALRRDLCSEAMRLTSMLIENDQTNRPFINALYALMCFQSSRFNARINVAGETILYHNQDISLWDQEFIHKGIQYLNLAAQGNTISNYHLEAGIAYWNATVVDSPEKWEHILQLYNDLLILEYSPVAALNRTYALYKVNGKAKAIVEAELINLKGHYLYHALLGELYTDVDNSQAIQHWQLALDLVHSIPDKAVIQAKILYCMANNTTPYNNQH